MKVFVLAVGRLKEETFKAAEAEYLKRLRGKATVEVRELKDEPALLAAVPARARLILLDEKGAPWSSEDFAKVLGDEELRGGGRPVAIAIGGADGWTSTARAVTKETFSLGRITLPHRLVRVVIAEQLYRAFSILRGEPYHRGS